MQPSYRTRREHPCPRTPPGGVSPTSRPSPAARASASPSRAETLDLLLDHVLIPVLPAGAGIGAERDRDKPRQGVVANTLKLYRQGAVGFIDWLDHSSPIGSRYNLGGLAVCCS